MKNLQSLRWAGLIGLAVVLVNDVVLSLPMKTRQEYGLLLLGFFVFAVAIVSFLLMPKAAGTLWKNKDLLLPLALLTAALRIIEWLTALPALGSLLNTSKNLNLFTLSFGLSIGSALTILLFVAYAAWTTAVILTFARTGQCDPVAAFRPAFKRFWRVFGLEFIGMFVVIIGIAVLIATMPALQTISLVTMAAYGVVWNYATAALLPVGLESEKNFLGAFGDGVRASFANLPKWWLLVLAHMLLLGLVMFFSVRWNQGGTLHQNFSWNVTVFWTGGYEDECRWYSKLVEVYKTTRMPIVTTLLTLLFGAMAVAMKLAIVQRLQKEPVIAEAEPTPTASAAS